MGHTAIKFAPVQVHPQACDSALAHTHLQAFAQAFIAKQHRTRWLHITLEKPDKAYHQMAKFCQYLDRAYCHQFQGVALFPQMLQQKYGDQLGVYFDGRDPACRLTPAAAGMTRGDAIYSLIPGKLAIFFFHEGWAWHCEK